MKDRYVIRYSGLTISIISSLFVPKVLFSYVGEALASQALLALGMGAFFAVVDLGTSRYWYSLLASLDADEARSQVSRAFGVVTVSAVFAMSLSFVVVFGVNIQKDHTLTVALVAAMGALSVTLPWYKNLLDGAHMFRRGEWLLFLRRLQPLVFAGFIVVGMGLGTAAFLTGMLIGLSAWLLFGTPKVTNVHNSILEYLSVIRTRSSRFDSMVWSISENLIYNSPMWFAFFFIPTEQQGVFVILIRIYNFLISVIRAPIEIAFLPVRSKVDGIGEMKKEVISLMIRSLAVVTLLSVPIIPLVSPVVDYITGGAISASLLDVISLYLLVLAATVMHPLGLAATSFPELIAWARIGSSLTVVFLFASIVVSAVVFGLTVVQLLLLFALAVLLNSLYLLVKILQVNADAKNARGGQS